MRRRLLLVVPVLLVVPFAYAIAVWHDHRGGAADVAEVALAPVPPAEAVLTLHPAPKVAPPTTTTAPPPPVVEPPPVAPPTTEATVVAAAEPEPVPVPVPVPPPPPPAPPPAPAPAPSGAVADVLAMHNAERSAHGLAPLVLSSCLNGIAQGWADHLAAVHQLGHNPSGLSQSLGCAGGGSAGENVGYDTTLGGLHGLWMSSGGHAANILNGAYTYVGIGVARSADGYYWVTVDFSG